MPDVEELRREALSEGALDPMSLRFRVVEYDKASGELLNISCADAGFREALETAADLMRSGCDSHVCLQPVGFVQ
jgi:hypothetical protein